MSKIQFTINYKADKRHLEKFIARYASEIGFELHDIKIDKYWKIEGQLQAGFFTEIDSGSNEEKVYTILKLANKLWSSGYQRWSINGPHEGERLVFECILNNEMDDQPIKWAHIELDD